MRLRKVATSETDKSIGESVVGTIVGSMKSRRVEQSKRSLLTIPTTNDYYELGELPTVLVIQEHNGMNKNFM
jgi:hypothetical protein